jgi:hypothetical protein
VPKLDNVIEYKPGSEAVVLLYKTEEYTDEAEFEGIKLSADSEFNVIVPEVEPEVVGINEQDTELDTATDSEPDNNETGNLELDWDAELDGTDSELEVLCSNIVPLLTEDFISSEVEVVKFVDMLDDDSRVEDKDELDPTTLPALDDELDNKLDNEIELDIATEFLLERVAELAEEDRDLVEDGRRLLDGLLNELLNELLESLELLVELLAELLGDLLVALLIELLTELVIKLSTELLVELLIVELLDVKLPVVGVLKDDEPIIELAEAKLELEAASVDEVDELVREELELV